MELKKYKSSDHSKFRTLFLCIGLCVSLLIIFLAFETKAQYAPGDIPRPYEVHTEWIPVIPRTEFPKKKIPKKIKPLSKPKSFTISTEPIQEILSKEVKAMLVDQVLEEPVFEIEEFIETYEGPGIEFEDIQKQASFPGGNTEWSKFLRNNIKYPKLAQRSGIEGKVFLSFYINAEGMISDIKVERGIGGGCDEEAIRVLKKSPRWNPGLQRGIAVKSPMSLYISFVLK
ncbi:energy transducer TonB [Roseivirga sp.]|uniref:energy transducer TonB n=1 Tax=Roseivirga sp. TaxID=1964215 RepID=UPI003B8D7C13